MSAAMALSDKGRHASTAGAVGVASVGAGVGKTAVSGRLTDALGAAALSGAWAIAGQHRASDKLRQKVRDAARRGAPGVSM